VTRAWTFAFLAASAVGGAAGIVIGWAIADGAL
jgi:hypothetical protein